MAHEKKTASAVQQTFVNGPMNNLIQCTEHIQNATQVVGDDRARACASCAVAGMQGEHMWVVHGR